MTCATGAPQHGDALRGQVSWRRQCGLRSVGARPPRVPYDARGEARDEMRPVRQRERPAHGGRTGHPAMSGNGCGVLRTRRMPDAQALLRRGVVAR